jgi:hypothetical protein
MVSPDHADVGDRLRAFGCGRPLLRRKLTYRAGARTERSSPVRAGYLDSVGWQQITGLPESTLLVQHGGHTAPRVDERVTGALADPVEVGATEAAVHIELINEWLLPD